MKLLFLCMICLSLEICVSSQNLQIQAQPQIVDVGEDELSITCSITNPSQIKAIFFIALQRNTSNAFEEVVALTLNTENFQEEFSYQDSTLQGRTTATGSLRPFSTAQLRLTFSTKNVICPNDFKEYRCTMSGTLTSSGGTTQETNPVELSYRVKPKEIEMPKVRILGEQFDTNERQFEAGTAIQLTCTGHIGSDPSATIRWCAKTSGALTFTGLPQTPVHSQASPLGCQYTRSSTITYNLTSSDTYTQFLCESGNSGPCETGTAKEYLNITLVGNTGITNPRTSEDTSDAGIIAGGVIGGLAFLILVILLVYFLVLRRKTDGETSTSPTDRTKEDVPGYNGPANPEGPVYSVPVKDHPPERQREDTDHHGNGTATQEEPRKELHYADLDIATQPPGTRVKPQPKPRGEVTNTEYASVTFGSTV